MKTHIFAVEVEQDEGGRWGADIPVLSGCAAWGYTKNEGLEALQEVMMEYDDLLPPEAEQEVEALTGPEVEPVTL